MNVSIVTLRILRMNGSDRTMTGRFPVEMRGLAGDANADGYVNSAEVSLTRSRAGTALVSANFREDFNTDGFLKQCRYEFGEKRVRHRIASNPRARRSPGNSGRVEPCGSRPLRCLSSAANSIELLPAKAPLFRVPAAGGLFRRR